MFRRILVPMDGSEHGVEALRAAVILAQHTGAELLTLYVRPDSRSIEEANADAETEARIQHTVNELCDGSVRVNSIFATGKPQDGILAAIWEQHPSLVILYLHNRHGLEALRRPSTTFALIERARVPLLIWPGVMNPQARDEWLTDTRSAVIVPLDGSKLAEQATPTAETFARTFSIPLLLFRAIPPVVMPGIGFHIAQFERQALTAEEHAALHYLREIRRNLSRTSGAPIETMIGAGDPSAAILDLAGSHPGSLIVMSTRGRSGFTRLLLGSVTFEVLHRTHVPVVLVPSHQYALAPEPQIAKEQVFAPDSLLELGNAKPILADIDGNTLE
ncbi:MAG TPA: universal stress protein [Ktedonobacterales bacterium]